MNLSEITKQLQQVLQLVDDWHEKGVDELDRDLALGKLREIYSQIRFGAAPQPETIAPETEGCAVQVDETVEPAAAPVTDELAVGVAISLDDVFEDFIPEELLPEGIDSVEEAEPLFDEHPEPDTMTELAEIEEMPIVESNTTPEEEEEEEEEEEQVPTIEEEKIEQTPDGDDVVIEEKIAEESPEQVEVEDDAVESSEASIADVVAESAVGQASLFGDDELFVSRASRRTKMMSLYDDEPLSTEKSPLRSVATEPEPQPAQTVKVDTKSEDRTLVGNIEIEVLEESDVERFVEKKGMPITPDSDNNTTTDKEPETVTLYVEPQIEVAEAVPAASAVPESEQVLGEVLKSDVQTIADTIKPNASAAEVIAKGAVADIGRAVGVNDRFLLIRDLFGGSSEEYERTIAQLNNFDNLEDCMIYIVENFNWNPNSDGTKLMMELIERKYS